MIEDTLVRRDIDYQVIGGTKFYERAEIKDAIAYLTVLGNPQDVVSFSRDRQLAAARDRRHVARARRRPRRRRWASASGRRPPTPESVPGLGTAAVRAFGRFMETMTALRERAEQDVPIGDLLESLLDDTGYIDALKAERTIEAQGREENLEELVERRARVRRDRRARAEHARRLPAAASRSSPTPTRAPTTTASSRS